MKIQIDDELLVKAEALIREASLIMLERDFVIKEKSSIVDLVTSADIAVQKFLEVGLTNILPGSIFLGEEGGAANLTSEYIWVVDPIDGTANFARDLELSVISVALLKGGRPYIGMIFNPYRDEFYYAKENEGAFCNEKRIHVSDRPFNKSMFCSAMSLYEKKYAKACFNIIEKVYEESDDLRRLGTAAYELCCLAAGKVDLYFEIRLSVWDYAAAFVLVREAGGYIEAMFDELPPLDKPAGVIGANTKENYEKIRKIVYNEVKEPLW